MSRPVQVQILRVDGSEESHVATGRTIAAIERLIGADCLDIVNLRDGRVMLVDDTGMVDGKPVNPKATELYHSVCRPGTPFSIHGDVAVANDADFGG